MSITSTIITTTSVLRGKTNAKANALPVLSEDYNKAVADLAMLDAKLIVNHTAASVSGTQTLTVSAVASGYIKSTGGAASLTLPTASELAVALGATTGSVFDLIIDTVGASGTATVVVGSGITVHTPVITGTDTLTVSVANATGVFKLVFISTTVAKLLRIA